MNADRLQQIESLALDILKDAYRSDSVVIPPIDLSKVIATSGLLLRFGQFNDPDIEGAYDRNEKTIFIREDTSYVRQAFTAAHELGHFFLHTHKTKETFYRRDVLLLDSEDKEEEQEANAFAASLLMPKTIFVSFWNSIHNVEEVAHRFGVSASAVYWRLKNLGLK